MRKLLYNYTKKKGIYNKIIDGIATIFDQDEALKEPWYAYLFAKDVFGADIEKCQEVACKNHVWAYCFAEKIPGANIEYCQEHACKNSTYAYYFAKDIPGADIEYCRKACESDPEILKEFDKMIAKMVLA